MSPRVVGLDDPEALDVSAVGAKAAGLARARREGLATVDGFVVTLATSAGPLRGAAAELARRGSGAARMVLLRDELDEALTAAIAAAAASLAEPLIARSSSALEGEGTWAGAFASLGELRRDEVPKALRSVWSAMFTLEALERFEAAGIEPGSAGMGVLVQTELAPDCGGAATVEATGSVSVSAVKGSPRDLLAGWVPGVRAAVGPDGSISGAEAVELIGAATLGEVAALARQAADRLDCNLIEWAVRGGTPVLLQVQRTQNAAAAGPGGDLDDAALRELRQPEALAMAREALRRPRTEPLGRNRVGRDRWEPFLASVAIANGEFRDGLAASPGVGAGRAVWVSSPTAVDHVRPRDVIVVQYPLSNFAPLLWDAAGLVALGGGPSAHLMEVARSLTVPAVVGCPLDDLIDPHRSVGNGDPDADDLLVTVDGDTGRVAVVEL
ncbi:MAG: PEP-utilizing enzyme [bacterium]|nr:PEP-utilizing enzyme [bacterium]